MVKNVQNNMLLLLDTYTCFGQQQALHKRLTGQYYANQMGGGGYCLQAGNIELKPIQASKYGKFKSTVHIIIYHYHIKYYLKVTLQTIYVTNKGSDET